MSTLIINQSEVEQLLSMEGCIGVMEEVLADLSRGACELPLRQILWRSDKSAAMALMPSFWNTTDAMGFKAVSYVPSNEGTELDSHQGVVVLFEAKRGRLQAVIDATSITAIRTAAVSAAATKLLARPDARRLAMIGSGVQARVHFEAMLCCRPISHVSVCSKTLAQAERFASEMSRDGSVHVEAVASVQQAVQEADIVCTTTSSSEPILQGAWLKAGTHINAVGACAPSARELDGAAVKMSRLFVDRRESTLSEAGDFLLAKKEGLVTDDHIVAEIGEVLTGVTDGRKSPTEITLFKSVGLGVEDLAAAVYIYQQARETGVGTELDMGGRRRTS